jgi:MscS family membrane protein
LISEARAWLGWPMLVLMLGLSTGLPDTARAQTADQAPAQSAPTVEVPKQPGEKLTVEDFSKPMGPYDEFNRGTPRGSMYGFIVSARKGEYERAAQFLDLRRLSPEERGRGPEFARQLKVILDQNLWVDFSTLSDHNEGFGDDGLPAWQDRLGDIETADGLVTLLLQRVPRKGDEVRIWKFSSTTVERIPALFEEFGPVWFEAWLPPYFFSVSFLGIELWQWLGLILLIVGGYLASLLLAGTIVRVLGSVVIRTGGELDERIARHLRGPVRLALTVAVLAFAGGYLSLDAPPQALLNGVETVLWVVSAAWLTLLVIDIVALGLRVRAEGQGNLSLVPALVPLQRFTKFLIVVIAVLGVLGTLGVNINAAIAGLGVGGIAVALAAQPTLENLFGGVSLFADRPVRVGDFFRYGDQVGTVEEIGLRSTRVRTLDRTVVTIPNAEFSNLRLENFAKRDQIRVLTQIGVRYETTSEQLRYTLAQLKRVLIEHPRVAPDPCRVRFVGFGAYSLDIEIVAYVDTNDWNEFLGIREDLYLHFMDVIKEAGTSFAFPSSTTYIGRDGGLDGEDVRRAEAQVAAWREQGALPFPDFPDDLQSEVENTLAWPPPGAPRGPKV